LIYHKITPLLYFTKSPLLRQIYILRNNLK
jgi:hypothetical protein